MYSQIFFSKSIKNSIKCEKNITPPSPKPPHFLFNIPNTASLPQNKAVKLYEIITFRNEIGFWGSGKHCMLWPGADWMGKMLLLSYLSYIKLIIHQKMVVSVAQKNCTTFFTCSVIYEEWYTPIMYMHFCNWQLKS